MIAYRSPELFGTERKIDPKSVVSMDKATKLTFNNYDYENGHVAIAPGSPCPILYGIRGDSSAELLRARSMIRGEAPDKWLMFMTNQATKDHIVPKRIRDLRPMMSVRVRAHVVEPPRTIVGGHVIVKVTDGQEIDAAFYEPSRGFREIARQLLPGDQVTLCGSVRNIFEGKEYIGEATLDELSRQQLADPAVDAAWESALAGPKFAGDRRARYRWWYCRTPYWDEQIGLYPVFRLMGPLPR